MINPKRPAGRPRRFAKFEEFEAALPKQMEKRPAYCDGIGIFNGASGATVWVKIRMPRGGIYKGRSIPPGGSVEHKLGKRSSYDWPQLVAERDRLQGLADRGEPLEAVIVETFAQYAKDWLERRKPTIRSYGVTKGNVNSDLIPFFGKKALNAITVGDINRWIGQQSARLKPSSVQRQLNVFNAIMNDAVNSGVIEQNPAKKANKIKGGEARLRFITEEEYQIILKTADKIEQEQNQKKKNIPQQTTGWLRHLIMWAYNSGMRRAEILNLTWNNIRTISEGHTVVEVIKTKTEKSRPVTCTPEMESILAERRKLERRASDDNRIFPISMTTAKRTLTRLWKATGLEDIRLHDLRGTHATILIANNINPREAAGRLGHTGTDMLAKHYASYLGDKEAAKVFGAIVANKAAKPQKAAPDEPEEESAGGSGDDAAYDVLDD